MLSLLGRAQEAIPILEEALSYEIADERKGRVFYDLGFCYQGTMEDQKAELAFERACKLSKNPRVVVGARYSLGALYVKKRQLGKALHELEWCDEHFVDCDVPRGHVWGYLVKVLRAIGRPGEAERYQKLIDASRRACKKTKKTGDEDKKGVWKTRRCWTPFFRSPFFSLCGSPRRQSDQPRPWWRIFPPTCRRARITWRSGGRPAAGGTTLQLVADYYVPWTGSPRLPRCPS